MKGIVAVVMLGAAVAWGPSIQPSTTGPYKVLQTEKVGGEGGWDYIYADAAGRRLYIPRGARAEVAATDTTPAVPAAEKRTTIFNLDTLAPAGTITGIGGNGAAVCPKTGHGFTSDHPAPAMFDVQTMKLIKNIEVPAQPTPDAPRFSADGIYCDTFNDRVYFGSHPTKSLLVVDAKDGSVVGSVDLGGTPEQTIADGKGTVYQVLQDRPGGVAVIDAKTLKVTAKYMFGDEATGNGSCNGLALDVKNSILFAACAGVGPAPARGSAPPPPPPAGTPGPQAFVILNAKDGKILARLPLPGGSDGAAFNPQTMEAFATLGNGKLMVVKEKSPTDFEVEENLDTMNGARTITLDSKTGHIFTMSQQFGPAPTPAPGATPGRGGRGPAVPGSFTILMIGR
jgi:hypothetical protein